MSATESQLKLAEAKVVWAFVALFPLIEAIHTELGSGLQNDNCITLALWNAMEDHPNQDLRYSPDELNRIAVKIEASQNELVEDLSKRIKNRPQSQEDAGHLDSIIAGFAIEWMGKFSRE